MTDGLVRSLSRMRKVRVQRINILEHVAEIREWGQVLDAAVLAMSNGIEAGF
jgi:hypothetical protein